MRALFLCLLLGQLAFAEEVPSFSAGETITLEIYITDVADTINVYRKTGVTMAPSLVGTIPVLPDVWVYDWSYKMPTGTVSQYRFWVVPKKGTELLDESNGVRVKRKK